MGISKPLLIIAISVLTIVIFIASGIGLQNYLSLIHPKLSSIPTLFYGAFLAVLLYGIRAVIKFSLELTCRGKMIVQIAFLSLFMLFLYYIGAILLSGYWHVSIYETIHTKGILAIAVIAVLFGAFNLFLKFIWSMILYDL